MNEELINDIKMVCDEAVKKDRTIFHRERQGINIDASFMAKYLADQILSMIKKSNKPKKKMAPFVLVEHTKYEGEYVALKSFNDRTVIAFGTDHHKVVEEAKKMGYASGPIIKVPKKGETWFFAAE